MSARAEGSRRRTSRTRSTWTRRLRRFTRSFPQLLRVSWVRRGSRRTGGLRRRQPSRLAGRLQVESLETRCLLTTSPVYVDNDWQLVNDVDHSHTLSVGDLV